MLVGPELPAGATQQDMGDYGGALLPGRLSVSSSNLSCIVFVGMQHPAAILNVCWLYCQHVPSQKSVFILGNKRAPLGL